MHYTLHDWQKPRGDRLVQILTQHPYALDASDCGTGKTFTALYALQQLQRPAVVVCPKAAHTGWRRVAEGMGLRDRVLDTVNPERISLGISPWYHEDRWHIPAGAMVIIDEIHKGASGESSKFTKAVALLRVQRIPALMMSATAADSPLKMRAVGFLLGLHDYNKPAFRRWCFQHGCFASPYHHGLEFTQGQKAVDHLQSIHHQMRPHLVRDRIGHIPGFPEAFLCTKLVDLEADTELIKQAYAEMDERMKSDGASALTALQHARERSEFAKCAALADMVQDEVDEGKNVVVFVNFRSVLARLAAMIPGCVQIYGSQKDRDANIDAFQSNQAQVCVCMMQAGGVSLSLHDVLRQRPRVSFLTPSWSASETRQALGRIHRDGGTPVVQTFVLAAGTVEEEKLRPALDRKLRNIDLLNDGDLSCT